MISRWAKLILILVIILMVGCETVLITDEAGLPIKMTKVIPFWIAIIAGFIGFFLGILAICVLAIGGRADADYERMKLERENAALKKAIAK